MRPSQLPDLGLQLVACDTESSGLYVDDGARVSTVSLAWMGDDDQIVRVALPFDQGVRDKQLGRDSTQLALDIAPDPNLGRDEWEALLAWLQQRRLVMQNAKHDLHMLRAGTRHWPGVDLEQQVVWDTMLANKELDPLYPTGLESTSGRLHLGTGKTDTGNVLKDHLKKRKAPKGRYDLAEWDVIEPYAAWDADITLRLGLAQFERIADGEIPMWWVRRERSVMRMLYRIETRGVAYDSGASLEAAAKVRKLRDELAKQLPFVPGINTAKHYFFTTAENLPYDVTETGKPKLDAEILRKMVKDRIQWAAEYSEWTKLDTALSMWYEGYPAKVGADGRLRTSFRQTKEDGEGGGGAVSNRFSVQRVQLHAIPHRSKLDAIPDDIPTPREFFHAKAGHVLYELDLQTAELRVATRVARCTRMQDLLEAGLDAHGDTAEKLFNVSEGDEEFFKYRQISKRANFGLCFGIGPDTFRADVAKQCGIELGRNETQRIVEDWRTLYPEYGRAIRRCQREWEALGYVKLVNGRRRYAYPGEYSHKAFNQKVQSSLAEFAKEWALATERKYPGVLVLLVHDSEVLEVPDSEEGLQIVKDVAKIGADLGTDWFTIQFGVDYGKWGEH